MIHIEFAPETIEQLQHEKRYHPHPRVRQKMEALYLKSQGMPHYQICQLVGIRGPGPRHSECISFDMIVPYFSCT